MTATGVTMTELIDRFDTVTNGFTTVAEAVSPDDWDRPAPPEGWVARDVVRHLVEWVPSLVLDGWGIERPDFPSVDDDPLAAWLTLRDALRAGLADPTIAATEADIMPGRFRYDVAVDMFATGDVLIHTWDLAASDRPGRGPRPRGGPPRLRGDASDGRGAPPVGPLRTSVDVPDDADEQTKLIAFTGRQPIQGG